jgi:hypothetical protein
MKIHKNFVDKLEHKHYLEELGADGRQLTRSTRRVSGCAPGWRSVARCCEEGNEYFVPIKGSEFE